MELFFFSFCLFCLFPGKCLDYNTELDSSGSSVYLPLSVHLSSAGSHTLQYQYTAVRGTNLPEFTAAGLVDEEQFVFYDDNKKEMIPKTEWIQKMRDDDPRYWNREAERMVDQQDRFHVLMKPDTHIFNHTEGVHTLQRMYSCELDDDSTPRGYDLYGYDGEDFMSLDLKTGTWTAANPQARKLLKKWDHKDEAKYWKSYLENECIDWLKKFVSYGRETLERKVRPEASVFHKHTPSPEVVCHATGFFPKALNITWQKDGEDVTEDMELNETLPNDDGSFQKRSILKVPAEKLQKHKYTCVVQHSSLEKDLILEVAKDGGQIGVVIGVVVVALLAVVAAVVFWKKRNSGFKPVPPKPSSEGDSSSNNSSTVFLPAEVRERVRRCSHAASASSLTATNWTAVCNTAIESFI
ncbi:BOLA class I histocompatibility antigen, alpha chain BL3-7-like isoform X2 [Neoarius graeffei]|uniref:BOLA class I histocompatibility antigen, alpha chain BL3-7-like isoform X2 n=1 Tax=Neoarius graeffei TaxID=443677 RepID=UPI00298CDE05|nr:BOLA class I histocompatibility antigen, alpha chain BL3-7-like isoform X2 [Neoarius graeffei]